MVKMAGSKFYYLEQAGGMAGAVSGDNLKLADPADAAKFLQESVAPCLESGPMAGAKGQQQDMRAQDYNAVAIEEGRGQKQRLSMQPSVSTFNIIYHHYQCHI